MSKPLLSVLIPTYRRPEGLAEAIRSVLGNGFSRGDFEVVVSDDDPGASGRSVVETLGDTRVRYVQHPAGPNKPKNWQFGVEQTEGTYVFKLDDDDQIKPGFLEATVGLMEEHPGVGSAYTAYDWRDVATGHCETVIDTKFFGAEGIVDGERYLRAVLVNEGGYPLNQKTTAVFRRDLAERMEFFQWASDDFSFSAALAVEADVGYIPRPLYVWSKHDKNSSADLHAVWRVARNSLDGLEKLPTIPGNRVLAQEWPELVDRCRQALPLYFLQASFRLHGPGSAWRLWRQFRKDEAMRSPWRGWLLVLPGVLFPRWVHRWVMDVYVSSPRLQSWAKHLLTRPARQ